MGGSWDAGRSNGEHLAEADLDLTGMPLANMQLQRQTKRMDMNECVEERCQGKSVIVI